MRFVLITARLEEATVERLVGEILPVRVLLDDEDTRGRWIKIAPARKVDFVAGQGLRLEAPGQLQWQAVGLPIATTFHSAQLMLRPEIADDEDGGRLVFRPSLEALDLKNVPAILDSGALAIVNRRLASRGDELAWHFGRALAFAIPLPSTIIPLDQLRLAVHSGKVEVLDDAIVLSVQMSVSFTRLPAPAET
jgi:hypothetical protein